MKTIKFLKSVTLFFFVFIPTVTVTYSQGIGKSCNQSILLPAPTETCSADINNNRHKINGQEAWFSFTANSNSVNLLIDDLSNVNLIEIFEGDCPNLVRNQLFNDTQVMANGIDINNLTTGNQYHINVQFHSNAGVIGLCLRKNSNVSINNIVAITSGNIPKYDKFEIGVSLNNLPTSINPFLYSDILVQSIFTSPSGKQYTIDGFYYQDFHTDYTTTPYWNPITTPEPFRIRFEPNEVGNWTYKVQALVNNTTLIQAATTKNFTCVSSGNPGFLKIAENNRYLEFENGSSFFGIGEDLLSYTGTSHVSGCNIQGPCNEWCYSNHVVPKYEEWIQKFAENGGNIIRIWMNPTGFEIEWPESITSTNILGDYGPRQYRAYDLDKVFEFAKQKKVYIHLIVMNPDQLGTITDNNWDDNPYKNDIPLTDFQDFFSNQTAIDYFKNKLRYIQSRWGYSTTLMTYEIVNEVDWVDHDNLNNFYPYETSIKNWYNEMSLYLKSKYPKHLINVSFAIPYSGERSGINFLPSIDFTNGHFYTADYNGEYQRSYYAQNNIGKYNKPFVMSELGIDLIGKDKCWISEDKFQELHNAIWSTTFSGSFSSGYYYYGEYKYNNSCWGGTGIKTFKPLSLFLSNETFNSSSHPFTSIGNAFSAYNSYSPALNQSPPSDAPSFDLNGYAPISWFLDPQNTLINQNYLLKDITTSNDKNIQVFALKNQNRVIGWVHNKNYYWYNLVHASENGTSPNPCTDFENSNANSTCSNITPLIGETLTINNLRCNGNYRVEWHSTQYDYDIDGDFMNDDGGVIVSTNLTIQNGTVTISIPTLKPTEHGDKPYAPDYGFKLIYLNNAGFDNGFWQHDYTDLWITEASTQAAAKPNGDYAISNDGKHIFFQGSDGYLQHYYWDSNTNKWAHDGLVSNWWTQPADRKVAGKIIVSSDNIPFYKGADGRMQHYYWNGFNWNHAYTDFWVRPASTQAAAKPSGDYAVSNDGKHIFFHGSDGYLQHFYWNSNTNKWAHDGLVPNWWTQPADRKVAGKIIVSSDNIPFYKGADGRMQHYHKFNNNWTHAYTDFWVTPASTQAAAKPSGDYAVSNDGKHIFFHGSDGYLQHFYWDSNTNKWAHDGLVPDWWTQPTDRKVAGKIIVSSDNIPFYKGADGRMQHYHKFNNNWTHAYTDFWVTPASTQAAAKPSGDYVVSNDGKHVYFHGSDGYLQQFYWDNSTNKWGHGGLVTNWWTQNQNYKVNGKIILSPNDIVFYKGADGRMQHYYWDNPCEHFGSGKLSNYTPNSVYNISDKLHGNTDVNNTIKLFPNPTDNLLTVELNSVKAGDKISILLIDILGRENILFVNSNIEGNILRENISTQHLADGVYIVRILVNDSIKTNKRITVKH